MGTRGLFTFLYKGKCIVMWNQFDSYPGGLGAHLLNQISQSLRNNKWYQFQLRMNYITMLSQYRTQKTFTYAIADGNCTINDRIKKLYAGKNDDQVTTFDDEIEFPYLDTHYREWDIETRLKQIPFILNLDRNNVYSHPSVAYSFSERHIRRGSIMLPASDSISVSYMEYLREVDNYYKFFDTDDPKDKQIEKYCADSWAEWNYIVDFQRNTFHVYYNFDSEYTQIDINENELPLNVDALKILQKYGLEESDDDDESKSHSEKETQ